MGLWFFDNVSIPKTAILDADGNQILETVTILNVQVSPSKQYSQHILEDGGVATDNVTDNQTVINMAVFFSADDYLNVYKELKAYYSANTEFIIQTRVDSYYSMYLAEIPHEESGKIANTISMNLNFVEQQLALTTSELSTADVESPSNSDTTSLGTKPASSSTTALQDLVGGFF